MNNTATPPSDSPKEANRSRQRTASDATEENNLRRRALGVLFALGEQREDAERILHMALLLNRE